MSSTVSGSKRKPIHRKTDTILLGAAQRFPDKVDKDPDAARALNTDASRKLAAATNGRGIFLIYISTDYVFSGAKGEAPYEADAKPAPTNLYGQTKLDGEKAVLEETKETGLGIVLRVPVLYGEAKERKESAVNTLVDSVWKAQDESANISMDDWSLRYPTNTEDVGRVCKEIAERYLGAESKGKLPSVLQYSSEECYTKYEMCKLFADILGLGLPGMLANKQGNDPGASVQRPYNTHLSTRTLKEVGVDAFAQDFRAWW